MAADLLQAVTIYGTSRRWVFAMFQLLNELTYHEYKELAEAAEKLFNKLRAMFAVRGGSMEFMQDFTHQAERRKMALRAQLRRVRRKQKLDSDKGSTCTCMHKISLRTQLT